MKSRLINISTRIPLAWVRERESDTDRGEKRGKDQNEKRKKRKRGNTREEFSCFLTPILGFMLGKKGMHEHTHTLTDTHEHTLKKSLQNVHL